MTAKIPVKPIKRGVKLQETDSKDDVEGEVSIKLRDVGVTWVQF